VPPYRLEVALLPAGQTIVTGRRMSAAEQARVRQRRAALLRAHGVTPRVS
jgi:hypothetical protein